MDLIDGSKKVPQKDDVKFVACNPCIYQLSCDHKQAFDENGADIDMKLDSKNAPV